MTHPSHGTQHGSTQHGSSGGSSTGGTTSATKTPTGAQPGGYPSSGHPDDPPKGPPAGFSSAPPSTPVQGTLTGNFTGSFQPDASGGKGQASGPSQQKYNGKSLDQLSDQEVVQMAGNFGPSVISAELFARAQEINKTNPGGAFGPSVLNPNYFPSSTPASQQPSAVDPSQQSGQSGQSGSGASGSGASGSGAQPLPPGQYEASANPSDPWSAYSNKDLQKIAQQEGVSYKPKASRDDLIAALDNAGVQAPPVSEFTAYHGPAGS